MEKYNRNMYLFFFFFHSSSNGKDSVYVAKQEMLTILDNNDIKIGFTTFVPTRL